MPAYVYAIGRIEPRFPTLSVEKEFAQATGRAETAGLTDRQALHAVLSQRQNRYLARQLCWVLTIEGLDTYILQPRDPADLDLLVEALRPTPRPTDVDVVIGMRGPIAPPELCNGLMVPIVVFDQIYSFDVDALIKSIPRPEKVAAKEFDAAAEELFYRIMQMADNAGATDEHRALNYSPSATRPSTPPPRTFRAQCLADRDRGATVALERRAQDRRRHLLLHQPPDRRHREVLHARRRHRGVPVPRHQAVAVLRPLRRAEPTLSP